jgi:hypothetical protein
MPTLEDLRRLMQPKQQFGAMYQQTATPLATSQTPQWIRNRIMSPRASILEENMVEIGSI